MRCLVSRFLVSRFLVSRGVRRRRARRRRAASPGPVTSGPADRRRALVSLVSGLPRENRGGCPVRPPPARLPRCRNGEVRPRGAGRPKTAGRLSAEEDLRLNTDPPSRDRPIFEPLNLEMPSLPEPNPVEPSLLEPNPVEPSRAEPLRPADREPPSSEPPSTPSRRRPPNLTLAVPAPSPAEANAAPRPAGDRCPGRPSLSWGSRRRSRPHGTRAAQAADRARPSVPLGQPQPRRVSAGQLPDRALARARAPASWPGWRPAGPPAFAARAAKAQRRRDCVQHERAQQHVVGHGGGEHVGDGRPGDPRVAEHDAEQGQQGLAADRAGRRHHDLEQRRVPLLRVAGTVVGQQPAEVPDQAEHQRVLAGEVAARRRDVQGEAGQEAGQHAGHWPAGQRQRRHHQQHQVGTCAAGKSDPVHDGQLEHDRDRDHDDGDDCAHLSDRPGQTRRREASRVQWRRRTGTRCPTGSASR